MIFIIFPCYELYIHSQENKAKQTIIREKIGALEQEVFDINDDISEKSQKIDNKLNGFIDSIRKLTENYIENMENKNKEYVNIRNIIIKTNLENIELFNYYKNDHLNKAENINNIFLENEKIIKNS